MTQTIYYTREEEKAMSTYTIRGFNTAEGVIAYACSVWNNKPVFLDLGHGYAVMCDTLTEAITKYQITSDDTVWTDNSGDLWIHLCD